MALKKSKLESGFIKIFNPDDNPPSSLDDCAERITDVIIDYLNDVKINQLSAPGIFPPPAGPGPDPSFTPIKLSPTTPPKSNKSFIESGLKSAMKTNAGGADGAGANKTGWVVADTAFRGYIAASFLAFAGGGYTATGATTPGTINLKQVFSSESDDSNDIASKLANHLHTFFTTSVFTGAYLKASFIGPGPHISPLV